MIDVLPEGATWIDAASLVGVVLTAVGVRMAYKESQKAKEASRNAETAVEAASAAIEETIASVRDDHLLLLLPQMHRLETDIDGAVRDALPPAVLQHHLATWKWSAGQLREVLSARGSDYNDLVDALKLSLKYCSEASGALSGASPDLEKVTRRVRKAIGNVTSELGGLAISVSITGSRP